MDEDVDKKGLEEWKTIREFISDYDTRKHELRKTGFSLITSLIAAQGVLYIYWNYKDVINTTTVTISPYDIISVILGVTIALIFAILFFEKGYRLYQEAAVQRALLLEKRINLQLTETIFYQFKSWQSRVYEYGVYGIFLACTILMAYATKAYWNYLLLFTIVGVFAMLLLTRNRKEVYKSDYNCRLLLQIFFERFKGWINCGKRIEDPYLDWSFYPIVCERGEKVAITLTNLNRDNSFTEFIPDNKGKLKKKLKEGGSDEIVFIKDTSTPWKSICRFFKTCVPGFIRFFKTCIFDFIRFVLRRSNGDPKNGASKNNDGIVQPLQNDNRGNEHSTSNDGLLFKIEPEDICQNYDCEKSNQHYSTCSEIKCIQNVTDVDLEGIENAVFARKITEGFKIKAGANRTWLLDTTGVKKGIYILYTPYNDPETLSRKIKII